MAAESALVTLFTRFSRAIEKREAFQNDRGTLFRCNNRLFRKQQ